MTKRRLESANPKPETDFTKALRTCAAVPHPETGPKTMKHHPLVLLLVKLVLPVVLVLLILLVLLVL